VTFDPRSGLKGIEEPSRSVGAPPPRHSSPSTHRPGIIAPAPAQEAVLVRAVAEVDRLPGVRREFGHQLVCQVPARVKATFESFRDESETNGDALVRLLASTQQQLVTHFGSLEPEDLGGGFFAEPRVKRVAHRREPLHRITFVISTKNAEALRALLDRCGLGESYSPLIEMAIRLGTEPRTKATG
jgi:hypothetical protein